MLPFCAFRSSFDFGAYGFEPLHDVVAAAAEVIVQGAAVFAVERFVYCRVFGDGGIEASFCGP